MSDIARDLLALQATSVFVAGDALLDVYVEGAVERISPEAPVPVVHETGTVRRVLGGAANVAANVAALGAHAVLGARVGVDEDAAHLRAALAERGISGAGLTEDPALPTIRKTRVLAGYQQIVRLDREVIAPLDAEGERALLERFAEWLAAPGPHAAALLDSAAAGVSLGDGSAAAGGGGRALVLADYAKGVLTPSCTRALIDAARAAGIPVLADPKDPDLSHYAGVTVLKPNRAEARAAAGADTDDPVALVDAVLRVSGADNAVVSLSAEGVVARGAALDGVLRVPTRARQVADVSGAGDTLIAVLAMGAAAGLELARSVELANVAAGHVCGKLGTAVLSPSELLEAFRAHSQATRPEKWLGDRALAGEIIGQARADGRRVVFANGCFDVLHAGHVALLAAARALGDVLVVGLNTDASVARLKGPSRPVSGLEDRAAVMSALAAVDFVCAFDEDTPLELILALRPDVLVKGGDYAPEDVVGGAEAAGWGGHVAIVPLLDGRSTTKLLRAGAAG